MGSKPSSVCRFCEKVIRRQYIDGRGVRHHVCIETTRALVDSLDMLGVEGISLEGSAQIIITLKEGATIAEEKSKYHPE